MHSIMSFLRGFGPAPASTRRKPVKTYNPNGKREVARRIRQIQKGQLKCDR
jgi:hypothetical protein